MHSNHPLAPAVGLLHGALFACAVWLTLGLWVYAMCGTVAVWWFQ